MLARIMDNQVWFEAYLQGTDGGFVRFAHHLHSREAGCLWFRLEILGPSCSAVAMAVAMVPIATTTTLQTLIQAESLETAAQCTL